MDRSAFVGLNNYPVGISRPDGILGRTAYTTSGAAGVAGSNEAAAGGIGVLGTSDAPDGMGVAGHAGTNVPNEPVPGTGVFGRGPQPGMLGRSTTGVGVRGESTSADGVEGSSTTGAGVYGTAGPNGLAGRFAGRTVVEGALEATTASVSGKSSLADVDASGPVKAAGNLSVGGQATVGALAVGGAANLGAAATVEKLSLPKTSGVVTLKRAAASVSVAAPVGLAIAVAAAFAIAGLVGVAIAGGGENGRPTEGVALASAKTAVVAQQLASAVAAYAVQAQAIASVDDLAAHGVQLRRAEQALAVRGATTAQRLRERAVAAREAATSEEGVAALQAFGREAQIIGVRLQSLLAALTAAPSASVYERTVRRIGDELERGAPAPGGAVGADDPVPAG